MQSYQYLGLDQKFSVNFSFSVFSHIWIFPCYLCLVSVGSVVHVIVNLNNKGTIVLLWIVLLKIFQNVMNMVVNLPLTPRWVHTCNKCLWELLVFLKNVLVCFMLVSLHIMPNIAINVCFLYTLHGLYLGYSNVYSKRKIITYLDNNKI